MAFTPLWVTKAPRFTGRLELACALYARSRLGKVAATEVAGVDFVTFQRALSEGGLPLYIRRMLSSDLQFAQRSFSHVVADTVLLTLCCVKQEGLLSQLFQS